MIGRRFIPILNESWMKRLFPNWSWGGVKTLIDPLDNSTDVEAQRLEPYQSQIRAQIHIVRHESPANRLIEYLSDGNTGIVGKQ